MLNIMLEITLVTTVMIRTIRIITKAIIMIRMKVMIMAQENDNTVRMQASITLNNNNNNTETTPVTTLLPAAYILR